MCEGVWKRMYKKGGCGCRGGYEGYGGGCVQGRVCVIEGVVWVMSEGEGVSLEDPTRQIHTYCTRLHARPLPL